MNDSPPPLIAEDLASHVTVSRWDLYTGFVMIGLFGFGGIGAAIYHVLVDRRRWLTPSEYTTLLGLGQVLPGANLINMATMVGDRFQGAVGSLLALAGLMSTPLISLVALATVYDRFSDLPDVKSATIAAAAGAVGLTMGTGFKLARNILKSPTAVVLSVATFGAIGVLRFPMFGVIAVLVPLAIVLEFRRQRA